MMRFVTVFAATVALSLAAPSPTNIFKIDITPEEAQQYLNSPPFNEPQLSGRTNTLPLVRWDNPQFRAAEAGPTLGHYWKNGHEIENTEDYVEDVYDASQFHGQDGLGGYAYGYKAPESSKVENRARSGDVTGSYTYKDGNNELIKVRYWADSEGFHQEDNLPKVELQPAQETEEVRQARLAHEKAWQEAADAAAQQPDPQGEYSAKYEYQQSASEPQGISVSAPGQPGRDGKAYSAQASYKNPQQFNQPQKYGQQQFGQQGQSGQQQGQFGQQQGQFGQQQGQFGQQQGQFGQQPGKFGQQQGQFGQQQGQSGQQPGKFGQQQGQSGQQQGQYSQQSAQYSQQGGYGQQSGKQQYQGQPDEAEPTGPPRGFFYAFDYPVSIIVRKDAQGQNGPVNPGQPIDHDTVGVNAALYG